MGVYHSTSADLTQFLSVAVGPGAPAVVNQAYIFMKSSGDLFGCAFTRKKPERAELPFAKSKVTGGWNGLRDDPLKSQHASRHVNCRGYQQVSLPASPVQNLFHFDSAFISISGVGFGNDMLGGYSPQQEIVGGDLGLPPGVA